MAGRTTSVELIAKRAVEEARKHIPVADAMIFGSQVDGTAHEWSDIDVAIFTPAAETWDVDTWLAVNRSIRKAMKFAVELHFFRARDLEGRPPSTFVGHILKTGKRVA